MRESLESVVRQIEGPILVLGASGFVGANLFHTLRRYRDDVVGTARSHDRWRLASAPPSSVAVGDLLIASNVLELLRAKQPKTVFNCLSYGAYSFEEDPALIYATNFELTRHLLEYFHKNGIARYIHAGSSSEYGTRCSGVSEEDFCAPNSHYSVSKLSASQLLMYYGKTKQVPAAVMRLFSAYGPLEDSSRFIPTLVRKSLNKELPTLVDSAVSRDFIYIDDAVSAFIHAAAFLNEQHYGETFNIGTGASTTIGSAVETAIERFRLGDICPEFGTMTRREWDIENWWGKVDKAEKAFGWRAQVSLSEGLALTGDWISSLPSIETYERSSKVHGSTRRNSISAVIACYKDAEAIPVMYERLTKVLSGLTVEYEIIFVNDGSPDNTEEVIKSISLQDSRGLGVTHSRNFGSQAAFVSGMQLATKESCVILDGDLQDPPEIINLFYPQWQAGYDVVHGVRVKREAPLHLQIGYKLFYRLFALLARVPVPLDVGDFALMDRAVVDSMLQFRERDIFLRGVRAYVGFRQIGVEYTRPERPFGRDTNSLFANFRWAKKAIISYSLKPLESISLAGLLLGAFSMTVVVIQVVLKFFYPEIAPRGITTVLACIALFGSLNLVAISVLGDYLGKVFDEVKARPLFVRKHVWKDGNAVPAATFVDGSQRSGR